MAPYFATGVARNTIMLVVLVAAIAFAAGQFAERYSSSGQRRWQLLLSQRPRRPEQTGLLALHHTGAPSKLGGAGDGQWCWVKVRCNGTVTSEQPGLQQAGAAAAVAPAAAAMRQHDVSHAAAPDGLPLAHPAAAEARQIQPATAPAPRAAPPVLPTQAVGAERKPAAKRKAPPKPMLDVVGEAHVLSSSGGTLVTPMLSIGPDVPCCIAGLQTCTLITTWCASYGLMCIH
jgi:hypothetical protein